MYEEDIDALDNQRIVMLDEQAHDFLGAITVYYDKETGELLFGIPVSKDDETKQFLNNLISELIDVVSPDGMEC